MLNKNLLGEIMREPSAVRRVSCVSLQMRQQVFDMAEHTDLLKRAKAQLLSFFPTSERGLRELLRLESSIADAKVYEEIPIGQKFAANADQQRIACVLAAAQLARITHDLPALRRAQHGLLAAGQFEQARAVQHFMQLNFGTVSPLLRSKLLKRISFKSGSGGSSESVQRPSSSTEKSPAAASFLKDDLYHKLVEEQGVTQELPRFVRTMALQKVRQLDCAADIPGFTTRMPGMRLNLQTCLRFVDHAEARQQ